MKLVYQARFESKKKLSSSKGITRYSMGFIYLEMHSIEQSIINKDESKNKIM